MEEATRREKGRIFTKRFNNMNNRERRAQYSTHSSQTIVCQFPMLDFLLL